MTHAELEEIEKLIAEAEQGPWSWQEGRTLQHLHSEATKDSVSQISMPIPRKIRHAVVEGWAADYEANAAYIAYMSPSTADRMVKRIRELEQVLEGLMKVCPLSGDMALMIRACQSGGTESAECADEMVAFYSGLDGAQDKARAALAVSGEDVGK